MTSAYDYTRPGTLTREVRQRAFKAKKLTPSEKWPEKRLIGEARVLMCLKELKTAKHPDLVEALVAQIRKLCKELNFTLTAADEKLMSSPRPKSLKRNKFSALLRLQDDADLIEKFGVSALQLTHIQQNVLVEIQDMDANELLVMIENLRFSDSDNAMKLIALIEEVLPLKVAQASSQAQSKVLCELSQRDAPAALQDLCPLPAIAPNASTPWQSIVRSVGSPIQFHAALSTLTNAFGE